MVIMGSLTHPPALINLTNEAHSINLADGRDLARFYKYSHMSAIMTTILYLYTS